LVGQGLRISDCDTVPTAGGGRETWRQAMGTALHAVPRTLVLCECRSRWKIHRPTSGTAVLVTVGLRHASRQQTHGRGMEGFHAITTCARDSVAETRLPPPSVGRRKRPMPQGRRLPLSPFCDRGRYLTRLSLGSQDEIASSRAPRGPSQAVYFSFILYTAEPREGLAKPFLTCLRGRGTHIVGCASCSCRRCQQVWQARDRRS